MCIKIKQYNECTLPASIFVNVRPVLFYSTSLLSFLYNWIILFYVLIFLRLIVFYYYIPIIVIATYFAESDTTE